LGGVKIKKNLLKLLLKLLIFFAESQKKVLKVSANPDLAETFFLLKLL